MYLAALALIVAGAAALRLWYGRAIERREGLRLPLGPRGTVPGAEPIDLAREGAPAVLLLHGGGDTPQVLAGLAAHLHEQGYAVRVPLLPGHGRMLRDFGSVTAAQWLASSSSALDELKETHAWVAIVGLSLGGALAVRLAADNPETPALVLLAPYILPPRRIRFAAATSAAWGSLFPYVPSGGTRSIHDDVAAAKGLGHGVFTPAALRALCRAAAQAFAALPRVRTPTLMVQSREDNRLTQRSAERTFERLGAPDKRLEWIEGAGHVITVDFGHEGVFARTDAWLSDHGGVPRR